MIRDTLVIARRELLERVKSKWFVAMTLLGPIFMIAMIVIPASRAIFTSGVTSMGWIAIMASGESSPSRVLKKARIGDAG